MAMALRARTKRQGGGSTGTGSYDPRRPNVATGTGSTNPGTTGTVISKPGAGARLGPAVTKPVVRAPAATYVRPPRPVASVATRGANSEALRANAASTLGIAKTQNRDAVYRAIMNLGDPTNFAKYQADPEFAGYNFTQDPNSVFASLARQETEGLDNIDKGTLGGNTFFSGMRLNDRQKLTDEGGRQRLGAQTTFGDDLKSFAASLGLAEGDYRQNMTDADQMDIDAALERDRIAREDWNNLPQDETPAAAAAPAAASGPTAQQRAAQQFAAAQARARAQEQAAINAARAAAAKKKKKK